MGVGQRGVTQVPGVGVEQRSPASGRSARRVHATGRAWRRRPGYSRRHLDGSGDLQEPSTDGPGLGSRHRGGLQAELADDLHQNTGEGREAGPQLVGSHRGRRGPVGKQIQLLLPDPVFHLGPCTVEILVQGPRPDRHLGDVGDDESGIVATRPRQPLRLGYDTTFAAPASERSIAEIAESPRSLALPVPHNKGTEHGRADVLRCAAWRYRLKSRTVCGPIPAGSAECSHRRCRMGTGASVC